MAPKSTDEIVRLLVEIDKTTEYTFDFYDRVSDLMADICNEAFTKKASLASHKKKHKTDKPLSSKNVDDITDIELCIPVETNIVLVNPVSEVIPLLNEVSKKKQNKNNAIV